MPNELLDTMLSDFLDESEELLTNLNDNLLKLDEWVNALNDEDTATVDPELMNEMFRSAHSLKGLSGMLGLTNINTLTHKVENVFDAARNQQLSLTVDIVETIFQAVDRLSNMVDALGDQEQPDVEFEDVADAIQQTLRSAGVEKSQGGQQDIEAAFIEPKADGDEIVEVEEQQDTTGGATPTKEDSVENPVPIAMDVENETDANQKTDVDVETDVKHEKSVDQPADANTSDLFAEITDDLDVPANYLEIYIDESEEIVDRLTNVLVDITDAAGPEVVEELLIDAHRFKGSAASVGKHRAAKLAHFVEDILQELRDQRQPLEADIAMEMLLCVDALRSHVAGLKSGLPSKDTFNKAAQALKHAFEKPELVLTEATSSDASEENESVSPEPSSVNESAQQLQNSIAEMGEARGVGLVGSVRFSSDLQMPELKARLVYEKLRQVGEVFFLNPCEEELDEASDLRTLAFGVTTECPADELRAKIDLSGVESVELGPFRNLTEQAEDEASTTESASSDLEEEKNDLQQESQELTQEPKTELTQAPAPEVSQAPAPEPAQAPTPEPAPESTQVPATESTQASAPEVAKAPAPKVAKDPTPKPAPAEDKAPSKVVAEKQAEATTSVANPSEPNKTPDKQPATPAQNKPAETLRVDIDRLDHLMNLAGQLVINKARFAQIGESLKYLTARKQTAHVLNDVCVSLRKLDADLLAVSQSTIDPDTMRSHVRRAQAGMEVIERDIREYTNARDGVTNLLEAVHQLDRVSDGLQKSVMDTRMVPVGPLFNRFKRVIRDITRSNGKDVRLEIQGEKTELDKRMIDELGDPLVHMVRNSADHGIESPEEREKAGKPRQGTVSLNAYHSGNSIIVQVTDDGKGIDSDMIRAKAIEKNIVSAADCEKMTQQQLLQLIWEPGLTTAKKVTDISGRGMGMDIVRSRIEDLNGHVEVESTVGVGTTFTIKLPLTLAILPSLMAMIEKEVFAFPIETVVEIVSVSQSELATVHGLQTADVRGRVVSVIDLFDVFEWANSVSRTLDNCDEITLVVIRSDGREVALVVDELLGEEDIVIKSMSENYRNVEGIAGASILGDGRVSLILDVPILIDMASRRKEVEAAT